MTVDEARRYLRRRAFVMVACALVVVAGVATRIVTLALHAAAVRDCRARVDSDAAGAHTLAPDLVEVTGRPSTARAALVVTDHAVVLDRTVVVDDCEDAP